MESTPVETELPRISNVSILAPQHNEFHHIAARSLKNLGIETSMDTVFDPSKKQDRVLMIGPMDHYRDQIESIKKAKGEIPPVAFWFSEQVPFPNFPFNKATSLVRYGVERQFPYPVVQNLPGNRFRRIGELLELNRAAPLTVHTFSDTNTAFMNEHGINTYTTPWGYNEELGKLQETEFGNRKTDCVFIGNTLPPRGQVIEKFYKQLRSQGISFDVYDGKNYDQAIYGPDRTKVLNNAKIMFAMPMRPWDDIHYRFLLAGANGNLLVAPELRSTGIGPFEPGEDFLMASESTLPDLIQKSLHDPQGSAQIAANLHTKVMGLNMDQMVQRVLTVS